MLYSVIFFFVCFIYKVLVGIIKLILMKVKTSFLDLVILDSIWCGSLQKFYVFDVMNWRQQPFYDAEVTRAVCFFLNVYCLF